VARRNALPENRSFPSTVIAWALRACLAILLVASPARAERLNLPGDIGIGLVGIADWSTQMPFIDVMKTARPWIGHRPGQWGGMEADDLDRLGVLDRYGWPIGIPDGLGAIGTVVLTDLPPEAVSLAGRYRVSFEGEGILEIAGRARNIRYGDGQVEFDFSPGEGPVTLAINRTDTRGTGDYIRNISIVHMDQLALHDSGKIFNPDWLNKISGFGLHRFMDWMETNDSTQDTWANRPKMGDYTYAAKGVPLEIMIYLANLTRTDPWFNIPHMADDDYVRMFANGVFTTLDPSLTAYIEYSNEVWNWQFEQASWAEDEGRARWGKEYAWMQIYGMRTAEVMAIFKDIYAGTEDRLVTILSTQTGWQGLELDALEAPLWLAENTNNPTPADVVDAYAVAGYFGRVLGTPERAPMVRGWIADSIAKAGGDSARKYDHAIAIAAQELRDGSISGDPADSLHDLRENTFPYQAEVANRYGLDLIMYEGGTHVTGIAEILDDAELTEFFTVLNYAPEMGALYSELLDIWHSAGGQIFNAYADVAMPGMWGSWGGLRHLDDDNPRWRALTGILESES